jgi:hypothetical protein
MRPNTSLVFLILPILFAAMLSSVHFEAHGQPQPPLPNFPGQGPYGNLGGLICGNRGATWNLKELPFIGCFGLSIGRTASGIVEGRQVDISVDAKGEVICKIDGTVVIETSKVPRMLSITTVPAIRGKCGRSAELAFCTDEDAQDCPVRLHTLTHNPDKSLYFNFSRRIFVRDSTNKRDVPIYLGTQEDWDADQAKRK